MIVDVDSSSGLYILTWPMILNSRTRHNTLTEVSPLSSFFLDVCKFTFLEKLFKDRHKKKTNLYVSVSWVVIDDVNWLCRCIPHIHFCSAWWILLSLYVAALSVLSIRDWLNSYVPCFIYRRMSFKYTSLVWLVYLNNLFKWYVWFKCFI